MQLTLFFFISFILSHRVLSSSLSSSHNLSHLSSSHLSHLPAHAVADPRHPSPHRRRPTPSQPTPSPTHAIPAQPTPSPTHAIPAHAVAVCQALISLISQPTLPSPPHSADPCLRPVLRSDPRHLSILFAVIEFVCFLFCFFFF